MGQPDSILPKLFQGRGPRFVFFVFFVAGFILFSIYQLFPIYLLQGDCMEPTLQDGERYCFNRLAYFWSSPKAGDLIVFDHQGKKWVSRIVATQGETNNRNWNPRHRSETDIGNPWAGLLSNLDLKKGVGNWNNLLRGFDLGKILI